MTSNCGPGHTQTFICSLQDTSRKGTVRPSPKVLLHGGFDIASLPLITSMSIVLSWMMLCLLANRNKSFTHFLKREFNVRKSVAIHGREKNNNEVYLHLSYQFLNTKIECLTSRLRLPWQRNFGVISFISVHWHMLYQFTINGSIHSIGLT